MYFLDQSTSTEDISVVAGRPMTITRGVITYQAAILRLVIGEKLSKASQVANGASKRPVGIQYRISWLIVDHKHIAGSHHLGRSGI